MADFHPAKMAWFFSAIDIWTLPPGPDAITYDVSPAGPHHIRRVSPTCGQSSVNTQAAGEKHRTRYPARN
jgi:hypothetical protein